MIGCIRQHLTRCTFLGRKNGFPILVFGFQNTFCVESKIAFPRFDCFNLNDFILGKSKDWK